MRLVCIVIACGFFVKSLETVWRICSQWFAHSVHCEVGGVLGPSLLEIREKKTHTAAHFSLSMSWSVGKETYV